MNKSIRLNEKELQVIKSAFLNYFSNEDHLWLFGSRVDIHKRGGDIDLYIETTNPDLAEIASKKILFLIEIKNTIGDQKIDVVIKTTQESSLEIHKQARNTGVQLV